MKEDRTGKVGIGHNHSLNGATKKIVLISVILIFVITLSAVISLVLYDRKHHGLWGTIGVNSTLGNVAIIGLGGIVYFIKKFMDTRSDIEKDNAKAGRMIIRKEAREARDKARNERLQITLDYKLTLKKEMNRK